MQKKGRNAKKKVEMQKKAENAFQFENSCQKRAKMEKKKAHLFGFFGFYIPCAFFLHFKPKNSYKKRHKCKKKQTFFFKLQK